MKLERRLLAHGTSPFFGLPMIPDKLKQTDQNIIELLRDRLSLQATSELPSPEEQLAYIAPQLAQAGIPEFVWASIINSHAITTQSSKVNNVKPMQITIIGGLGRMGRFFTQQLLAAGHNVSILENDDWQYADQLLNQVDLVLISVPIERTVDVIKRAAKYLAPTTAICDITSIKTQPVAVMLAQHPGPVMGLHPMFGPNIKSFSKQKVVVCPGRENHVFQWFLDFIKSQGGELIVCTPEEHDQMMVIIQATQHFSRFSLGVFLAQEKVDIERSLSMSSPSYRQEIDIVKRLFAQNPNLCIDIMLATEERCEEIRFLAETYSRLATLVEKRDRAGLIQEFETAQIFFTEDKKTHLKALPPIFNQRHKKDLEPQINLQQL